MLHFNQGVHLFVCPFKKNVCLFVFNLKEKVCMLLFGPERKKKGIYLKFSNNFQKVYNLMHTLLLAFNFLLNSSMTFLNTKSNFQNLLE